MAFDRSKRFVKSLGQTPPAVGPGSYEPLDLFKTFRNPDGLYAFLSSSTRNTIATSKDAIRFPGPGSYDVKEFKKHIPGGCSIDFTDTRSKYYIQKTPGPTDYRIGDDDWSKNLPRKQRSHPGTWRGTPGSLHLGPPPRSLIASGISVPTNRDANGYDVNEFGYLIKNPPDEYQPSLFYDIPREEINFNTVRYKGNFWSRMTGRNESKNSDGPGPGEYHLERIVNPSKLIDEKFRESRRMRSNQLRYIDAVFRKKQREGYPAPNAYEIPKSVFDSKEVTCECDDYIFKSPPFGRGAKRFKDIVDDNPAPGNYDPNEKKKCSSSVSAVPFGSSSVRFKSNDSSMIPGPGEYFSVKDGLAYDRCKNCKRNNVKGGFNSSAERTSIINFSDGPGPDKYPIKLNWKLSKARVHNSVFKSNTKRFKVSNEESLAPNSYDVMTAYKSCNKPCEFLKCPQNSPFNSRTIRLPEIPAWMDINVPGPGLTDTRGDIAKNVKGGSIACEERFKKLVKETGPGPQDYTLHPHSGCSILQRHFNVTLGRPTALKDLQPPPARLPWARRRGHRRKKMLHTFTKAGIKNENF